VKPAKSDPRVAPAVWLTILTMVGAALRLQSLGRWNLEGDEIFTLRDSIVTPSLRNARPLIYFLNYHLIRPWAQLDELSLRVLPAIFGILAIPTAYLVVRRLLGTRAGLFAALLLTFSALHVYQSQNARYWSLVFLLSLIFPAAFYIGIREQNRKWIAFGAVTGLLAILAHPVAGLLFGGLLAWAALPHFRRDRIRQAWTQPTVRWVALALGAVTLTLILLFWPVLHEWMMMPHEPRHRGAALIMSYVDGLTVGLVLIGTLGILWLWQTGQRSLAFLLGCLVVVPMLFCVGFSYFTAVSTAYLLPTAPVFFIGAAAFLDRFAAQDNQTLRPRGLVTGAVVGMLVLANVPVLISHYLDGSRGDFRSAARYVQAHWAEGDVIYSDQYPVLQHYLPGAEVFGMTRDPINLERALREARQERPEAALWTVALVAPRGGFRTHSLPRVSSWLFANCRLAAAYGVPRLDFRQNEVQVYRCPPEANRPTE
jgi:4-amino-4-deoxy-L-arabinose transferase-like glycosyltransferase